MSFSSTLYTRALAHSDPFLLSKAANLFYRGCNETIPINLERAFHLYERAHDLGSIDATYRLGLMIENEEGCVKEQNIYKAVELYELAAANGHMDALFQLGELYKNGNGVVQNDRKAFLYYEQAAEKKHLAGLYEYAMCFYKGWGVERNDEKCRELLSIAAKLGNKIAEYQLNMFSPPPVQQEERTSGSSCIIV